MDPSPESSIISVFLGSDWPARCEKARPSSEGLVKGLKGSVFPLTELSQSLLLCFGLPGDLLQFNNDKFGRF